MPEPGIRYQATTSFCLGRIEIGSNVMQSAIRSGARPRMLPGASWSPSIFGAMKTSASFTRSWRNSLPSSPPPDSTSTVAWFLSVASDLSVSPRSSSEAEDLIETEVCYGPNGSVCKGEDPL